MDPDRLLAEDQADLDVTTDRLRIGAVTATAQINAEAPCTVAGIDEAVQLFRHQGVAASVLVPDGERVYRKTMVLTLQGPAARILSSERTALNIIMRMSGIATLTTSVVLRCQEANPSIVVAATRKGTPGFREQEKRAVLLGGGDPHRFSLADGVLVKENHLVLVPLDEAIRRARGSSDWPASAAPVWAKEAFSHRKVEVEVRTAGDALQAARAGAEFILLDNPTVDLAKEVRGSLKKSHPAVRLELSGGITPENAPRFAPYGDVLSIGALTHSAPAIPFSLDLIAPAPSAGGPG